MSIRREDFFKMALLAFALVFSLSLVGLAEDKKADDAKTDAPAAAPSDDSKKQDAAAPADTASPDKAAPAKKAGAKTTKSKKNWTTDSGVKIKVLKAGKGKVEASSGSRVTVHYTGWLTNGKKFDSSVDCGSPFTFPLGGHQVIQGWEDGVVGMKVGEKRKLTIPPNLAYGERGAGGVIPPNATLVFDVELLGVE